MRARRSVLAIVLAGALGAPGVLGATSLDVTTRALTSGALSMTWSAANPEAIISLSWRGSSNLTRTAGHEGCPGQVTEFFGDAWGTFEDENFVAPVGGGGTGEWAASSGGLVSISSAAQGCYGGSGIPVVTTYAASDADPAIGRVQVERRFAFPAPFAYDLRTYIPRLYPTQAFTDVVFPNAGGTALLTRKNLDCGRGCFVPDWNGSWYAVHDPTLGRGMIVRHEPTTYPLRLWVDEDAASSTTATGALLIPPSGGFTGTLVDRQVMCLYDASAWTPSLTLPAGCTAPWAEPAPAIASRIGGSGAGATYATGTRVAALGRTVTWRAQLPAAAAGQVVDVLVSTRRSDGAWSAFTRLTTRRADSTGVARYSMRATTARWVSVRFSAPSVLTPALQARWR